MREEEGKRRIFGGYGIRQERERDRQTDRREEGGRETGEGKEGEGKGGGGRGGVEQGSEGEEAGRDTWSGRHLGYT
jgi:hypothetical protein